MLKESFGEGRFQLIGTVELLLEGARDGLSRRAINEKIVSFGGSEMVDNKLYETASKLEKMQLTRFQKNIAEICRMINDVIPAHVPFRLHEDVKIVKYFADGDRYSSGDVLPRSSICTVSISIATYGASPWDGVQLLRIAAAA